MLRIFEYGSRTDCELDNFWWSSNETLVQKNGQPGVQKNLVGEYDLRFGNVFRMYNCSPRSEHLIGRASLVTRLVRSQIKESVALQKAVCESFE